MSDTLDDIIAHMTPPELTTSGRSQLAFSTCTVSAGLSIP
jgi:hypothetical protein